MPEPFFGPEAWSPLEKSLRAYFEGDREARLNVFADEGEADPMDVSIFFRSPGDLGEGDRTAVDLARGRVLDIGAGVGSISLALQARGLQVAALEVMPEAVKIMRVRGVVDPRLGRMEDMPRDGSFDTLVLLMNGIALAGTLARVPEFLRQLDGLLAPGGQILIDSTDLVPVSADGQEEAARTSGGDPWSIESVEEDYPGEFQYQLEFSGQKGAPFPQLFLDSGTFGSLAVSGGFRMDVVWRGDGGGYLAKLTRVAEP